MVRFDGLTNTHDQSDVRLTLDTQEDYELLAAIYERFYRPGDIIALADAVKSHDEIKYTKPT